MKRIPHLYMLFLPYIIALGTKLLFSDDLAAFFNDEDGMFFWIVYGMFILISCILAIIAVISGIIISVKSLSPRETAVWNLVTKLAYLPVHATCVSYFLGMMNPFLLMVSWVPVVSSLFLQGVSSTMNIGACMNGYKSKKMGIGASVILALLSYVYIIDIIAAVVELVKCMKNKTTSV